MFSAAKSGAASSGYNLTNSLRFRSSASAYLSRTPASAGNRKTWTYSGWVKRGTISVNSSPLSAKVDDANRSTISFVSDNLLFNYITGGTTNYTLITNAVFRDIAAWYHIVFVWDTTQATAANRMKFYVNGVEQTYSTATYPTLNLDGYINNNIIHGIGWNGATGASATASYIDGYITEVNFVDGQALTPSSFGETDTTTGVWKPKAYTGTYGTNGFELNFSDNSALTTSSNVGLGKDFSGNANYWVTNNISITAGTTYDSMTDVLTLTSINAANYCVLNPIDKITTATLSNANLDFTTATTGQSAIGSIGMTSGKYYWEAQTSAGTTQARATVYGTAASTYYSFAANNTVYGFRFDATAGTLDYTTNGSSFTSLATGLTSGPYFAYFNNNGTTSKTISVNFGQRPFTYTPPTGYNRLNTYNLPTSTIVKGNSYMDATLYTGNLTGQSITNAAAFKPDLVWIKSRSAATDNKLTDFIRGTTKALISNTTGAETTDLTGLTAFNTNGFTVGASTVYNNTGATYVGWQWIGTGATVSNTNGTITSTVDANTTAGFSIVTYTIPASGSGWTVGHGLGVAPKLIIAKARSTTLNWVVYHISTGNTNYTLLNTTALSTSDSGAWNNTSPTSTVFTNGTTAFWGANATYVAYCWAEIEGFSKFGSYTGNGSTDGTFVYTGFRPKFLFIKNSGAAADWRIYDTSRSPINVSDQILFTNTAGIEGSGAAIDIVSNGFKLRNTANNGSANTYIYAAFAENPFKNALAR